MPSTVAGLGPATPYLLKPLRLAQATLALASAPPPEISFQEPLITLWIRRSASATPEGTLA